MGLREHYTPGTPSWAELSTADQDGAKRFYAALFGWELEDNPIGEGAVYTMAGLDGQPAAAISPQPAQQREAGVPPMWNTYITVEDADASLARASELGGTVHAGPFDVMEVGRMGVVQDPQGAFFEVWQPRAHIGAGIVNGPGAFSWCELVTPDPGGAQAFYGELFGWAATPFESSPTPYWTIANAAEHTIGGMREPQPGEPPYWLVYFGCEAIESAAARAAELGAEALHEVFDIGAGKIVTLKDPEGAVFALYAGNFED